MSSVLQKWVMDLSLREQGTLLVALRGCDLAPKKPLDSIERRLTSAIRGAVMVPADSREVDSESGCFMTSSPPEGSEMRISSWDHYPLHWVLHLVQACEVIAYSHPMPDIRFKWRWVYFKLVAGMHLLPEEPDKFKSRMLEDRVATGTIVS